MASFNQPPPIKDIMTDKGGQSTHVWRRWFEGLFKNLATKADLLVPTSENNVVVFDADGNLADSGIDADDVLEPKDVLDTTNEITVTDNGDGTVTISLPDGVTIANLILTALTAEKPVWTDANKKLISQDINLSDVVHTRNAPTSITVNSSDGETGTVADVATFGDGNFYQVEEASAAASFDFEFNFTGITSISRIGLEFYYAGSAGHHVDFEIWNYTTSAWIHLFDLPDGLGFNYRFIDLPVDDADYISAGAAKLRIDHSSGGISSHYIQVRYVAIFN